MGRPSWLPVPDFALQTLLGEGATVVLEGQRVLPARTQAAGFRFRWVRVCKYWVLCVLQTLMCGMLLGFRGS